MWSHELRALLSKGCSQQGTASHKCLGPGGGDHNSAAQAELRALRPESQKLRGPGLIQAALQTLQFVSTDMAQVAV